MIDDQNGSIENEGLKALAAALVDLKTFSRGRGCFKKHNHQDICTRRDEILSAKPGTSYIGAYQTSFKELWDKADQDYWEKQAVGEMRDIYE